MSRICRPELTFFCLLALKRRTADLDKCFICQETCWEMERGLPSKAHGREISVFGVCLKVKLLQVLVLNHSVCARQFEKTCMQVLERKEEHWKLRL